MKKNDLGSAIKNTALDQMCNGLRKMGVPEADIQKARKEADQQNSDRPLLELAKQNPLFQRAVRQ